MRSCRSSIMEHRGIQFRILQTTSPNGFKWTVDLPNGKTKEDETFSRSRAIACAIFAIDKKLKFIGAAEVLDANPTDKCTLNSERRANADLFYVVNSKDIPDSDEGEILENDEAAWHEATLVAGEIFKDVDGNFRPGQEWHLEVRDEKRRPLFSINVTSKELK